MGDDLFYKWGGPPSGCVREARWGRVLAWAGGRGPSGAE